MTYLLDDFSRPEQSCFGTAWILFTDEVSGGTSRGELTIAPADGEPGLRLRGEIASAEGFVQAALPLVHSRYLFDARHFEGVQLRCRAPETEGYFVYLRTRELSMPWQHYRAAIAPGPGWQSLQLPFSAFVPTGTGHELNLERLSRLGLVAAGRCFSPDLQVAEIGFY